MHYDLGAYKNFCFKGVVINFVNKILEKRESFFCVEPNGQLISAIDREDGRADKSQSTGPCVNSKNVQNTQGVAQIAKIGCAKKNVFHGRDSIDPSPYHVLI